MNRKKRVFLISLLALIVVGALLCGKLYQEAHRVDLNRMLIRKIHDHDASAVHALLMAGADARTHEMPEPTGSFWQSLLDLLNPVKKPKAPVQIGPSALMLAVQENQTAIAIDLLAGGANDVNAVFESKPDGDVIRVPLLVEAAGNANPEIVVALLDKGANVNAVASYSQSALLATLQAVKTTDDQSNPLPKSQVEQSKQRQDGTARLLLDRGADPNARNSGGNSPLLVAASLGDEAMIKLLLERGATVKRKRGKDEIWSPVLLSEAIQFCSQTTVEELIRRGADVNDQNNDTAPLVSAVKAHNFGLVKLLLSKGAAVNVNPYTNGTPLSDAVKTDDIKMIRFLLARGADVDDGDEDSTPLMMTDNAEVVKILVVHGADLDFTNHWGQSSKGQLLHFAEKGNVPIVKFLIRYGADVNWVRKGYEFQLAEGERREKATALSLARKGKHAQVVALLKRAGAKN